MNHRINILNIPFDSVTLRQALETVLHRLINHTGKPFFIATPNPEMLLEAAKNPPFQKILQETDLNIPDGFGIILASKFLRTPLPERVTGTDLMQEICVHAPHRTKVFLLGAAPGVAEQVKVKLEATYSNIEIVGTMSGTPWREEEQSIISHINHLQPELLFVAFGAPKQELWLARNLHRLQTVKVAMGVGGAFDFIAGIRKRAPAWVQKLGLEWLYRVIKQPSRIKRIFNATVKFPLVFLRSQWFGSKK